MKDVSFGIDTMLYNPEFVSLNIRSRMLISSHRRSSIKKDVLKNFAKFTEKHLCWSFFIIKPQGSGPQKETPTQVYSCEFCEKLKISCLQNTSMQLLLKPNQIRISRGQLLLTTVFLEHSI